jgi:hypothetical protein
LVSGKHQGPYYSTAQFLSFFFFNKRISLKTKGVPKYTGSIQENHGLPKNTTKKTKKKQKKQKKKTKKKKKKKTPLLSFIKKQNTWIFTSTPLQTLPLILNEAANLQHPFVNLMQGENPHECPRYLYSNLERCHLHQPYRRIYVQFSQCPHST